MEKPGKTDPVRNKEQNQVNPLDNNVEKGVSTVPDSDKPEIGPDSLRRISE